MESDGCVIERHGLLPEYKDEDEETLSEIVDNWGKDEDDFDAEQLHKNLDKIKNNYHILSNEDEETIKRIANKL